MCSNPTDRRTMSGRTPTRAKAASSSGRRVVEAGCATKDLKSPTLTRRLNSFTLSKKAIAAS